MKPDSGAKSQIFNVPRLTIAAPASGSGKTTLTCALLRLLQIRGKRPVSFKCGPDFIDPMFHEQVLGVPSTNLDSFFVDEDEVRSIFAETILTQSGASGEKQADFAVIEGVMGLFDGLAGKSLKASSYDIARITNTPILLCLDTSGMSRSIVPLIKGFLDYDRLQSGGCGKLIKGIFLNKVTKGSFQLLKSLIEEECAGYGVKVIGYLPKDSELTWESRHLGLFLPGEIRNLTRQIQKTAEILTETVDFTELEKLSSSCGDFKGLALRAQLFGRLTKNSPCEFLPCIAVPFPTLGEGVAPNEVGAKGETSPIPNPALKIAVARDEAFCFYYRENLRLLEEAGAELLYFSPLHDKSLPSGVGGILLGGGYPELYASSLQANESMRASIKAAVKNGISVLAECGGFMYLQEKLTDRDGVSYEMCGAIKGECAYTGKLVRFGYGEFWAKAQTNAQVKAQTKEGLGLGGNFSIKGHEFHYFDSTNNGSAFTAKKPLSSRTWDCMIFTPKMLAGFPHLYYRSNPEIVRWFLGSCKKD
ncbi:MAG: cobyrinate a,c-diamide synthase [Treponema sp.]|nr:cobyrinate a,c-diamide synthase [Treponema sp.]